jgi:hypothetical protein
MRSGSPMLPPGGWWLEAGLDRSVLISQSQHAANGVVREYR